VSGPASIFAHPEETLPLPRRRKTEEEEKKKKKKRKRGGGEMARFESFGSGALRKPLFH